MRVFQSQIASLLSSAPPPRSRPQPAIEAPPEPAASQTIEAKTPLAPPEPPVLPAEPPPTVAATVSLRTSILGLLRELSEPIHTLCALAREEAAASPTHAESALAREAEAREILEQVSQLQASLTGAFGARAGPAPEPGESAESSPGTFSARSFRLAGPTQKLSVLEALEFVRATRRTGHLVLSFEDGDGCLSIDAGEVVGARFGDELGFDALCSILHAADGYLQFVIDPVRLEERNLAGSTLMLVLSALQCLDERDLELRR